MLGKYGVPLYEEQMVEHLLDHIMSPNTEFKTEVNICSSLHSSTFVKASNNLSAVVARLYPSANPSSRRFRKRRIYAAGRGDRDGKRGGSFNDRGCGRGRGGRCERGRTGHVQGGRGGCSGAHENGIDISDFARYFEDSEWVTLSKDTRESITEDPVRTKLQENENRCTTSYVSARKENENWLISQIINGVQNASRNESGLAGGVTHFPTNGIRTQVHAANRVNTSSKINETEEQSVVIYDHLGKLVKKT